jgi:hypothetical protein
MEEICLHAYISGQIRALPAYVVEFVLAIGHKFNAVFVPRNDKDVHSF